MNVATHLALAPDLVQPQCFKSYEKASSSSLVFKIVSWAEMASVASAYGSQKPFLIVQSHWKARRSIFGAHF